ncbi:TetR/AcrR family transcriptional regulator [Mucilaginibacter sp.]|uniref:TetR/AcrR family transcriptional regulator n=1 Tax=Mucilaginibacter sp. TaxID=1882438 RepID=UPI002ED6AE51
MKTEILEVSLRQFLQYGIRDTSVQKIVDALGISTKTFYKYYKNKEELLADALDLFFNRQYQDFRKLNVAQNAAARFFDIWLTSIDVSYQVNKIFFHDLQYYYPDLAAKSDAANSGRFTPEFLNVIERGIHEGLFRNDIIPGVVLESIFVLYEAVVRAEHFKRFNLAPYDLLLNTIALAVRGICTHEGIIALDEQISIRNIQAAK